MSQLWRLFLAAFLITTGAAQAQVCRPVIEYLHAPANPCLGSARVRIAAAGDVLLHRPLQRRGYAGDGFRNLWAAVEPYFKAADIAYANLEGPVAAGITRGHNQVTDPGPVFDDRVYSSFPLFNYHASVLAALKASGITLVSTANNHALDRGPIGVDKTIAALRAANLPFTGTIQTGGPRDFVTYTDTALGRIAWIACSYSTNGLPDPNAQTLLCYDNRAELLGLVSAEATRADTAAVIVTPHWGYEYSHTPNANQRELATQLAGAGATAVIGTHPHVVQPMRYLPGPNGQQSLIAYSTGNFVSGQVKLPRRTGALAWIELCRAAPPRDLTQAFGAQLAVAHAGAVPIMMTRTAQGPELILPKQGDTRLAGQALRLVNRHIPDPGLRAAISCEKPDTTLIALQ